MKTFYATLTAIALSLAVVHADEKRVTTTTTTENGVVNKQITTSTGTLTEFSPGTTFIVKETSGPVTYSYGKEVVYATKGGRVLTDEDVRARIRVGLPVSVQYMTQGDSRIINRVIIDD
jgi:hypothetical protein